MNYCSSWGGRSVLHHPQTMTHLCNPPTQTPENTPGRWGKGNQPYLHLPTSLFHLCLSMTVKRVSPPSLCQHSSGTMAQIYEVCSLPNSSPYQSPKIEDRRKFCFQWGWQNTGTGCSERRWMRHPWKHPRPGWMGLWACSFQGVGLGGL